MLSRSPKNWSDLLSHRGLSIKIIELLGSDSWPGYRSICKSTFQIHWTLFNNPSENLAVANRIRKNIEEQFESTLNNQLEMIKTTAPEWLELPNGLTVNNITQHHHSTISSVRYQSEAHRELKTKRHGLLAYTFLLLTIGLAIAIGCSKDKTPYIIACTASFLLTICIGKRTCKRLSKIEQAVKDEEKTVKDQYTRIYHTFTDMQDIAKPRTSRHPFFSEPLEKDSLPDIENPYSSLTNDIPCPA